MASKTSGIAPVGNNNYQTTVTTNTDGSLSATTYRVDRKGGNPVAVSTTGVDKDGKTTRTYASGATDAEKKAFADPNSPERQAYSQQVLSTKPYGDTPTAEQTKALNNAAGKGNTATNPEDGSKQGGATDEQKDEFEKEQGTFKQGTRLSYGLDMRYPLDLALEHQDCIKFSILKYRPSGADASKSGQSKNDINRIVKVENGLPGIKGSERIGTITFPIPAGISDSNSVDWQQDTINQLQESGLGIVKGFITGGAAGAEKPLQDAANTAQAGAQSGELQQGLTATFAGLAVNSSRAQQRLYGSIFNNNLELLFNGPTLRSAFTFNFKLSPRDEKEAKEVRKIIRAFKQSMAVKRSATSLLLKTPHTYAISYLTSNQDHPYLNKFKECALISCNVDYSPEGTYMTYMSSSPDGRSMVSYNLSLTFQELEPIFDDDYAVLDNNADKFIGF